MEDIVNAGFIIAHKEEILKTGDIIPKSIMKYIPNKDIEKYFEYHKRKNTLYEEINTINEWINSQDIMLFYDSSYDEIIELLEDWVECYPQFKGILNKDVFDKFIKKDGKINPDQPKEIKKIEKRFHDLIKYRASAIFEKYKIPLPKLSYELINHSDGFSREAFPVPGMYGGFYYFMEIEDGEYVLYSDSWSRVVGGSGQSHRITVDECKLIAEGFV